MLSPSVRGVGGSCARGAKVAKKRGGWLDVRRTWAGLEGDAWEGLAPQEATEAGFGEGTAPKGGFWDWTAPKGEEARE